MRIELTQDSAQFADRTREFLAARYERNVLATVLDSVLRTGLRVPSTADDRETPRASPVFAIGSDRVTGEVVAAALRTPPWPMLATGFDNPADASALIEQWLKEDPTLNELGAEPATAEPLLQAWRASTGGSTQCLFREALHSLTTVSDPARLATGRLRQATGQDRDLLIEWEIAFAAETRHGRPSEAAFTVDRRLLAGHQFVWEDDRPTSTLGHTTQIAGAVRIGPVYTPPECRNSGYASAAVAALSRRLLECGAQRCLLFTDLANPTSNRIYASVGYVRFADWEQHRLLR
jgi:predicted GNAT family acetyltransferase